MTVEMLKKVIHCKKKKQEWPTYRVFQIVLRVGGRPPSGGGMGNFDRVIFYPALGIRGEVVLNIRTFLKAKNNIL